MGFYDPKRVYHTPPDHQFCVSIFDSGKGIRDTIPTSVETLEDVIALVRSTRYKEITEAVRTNPYGSEAYNSAKTALPYVTPNGVFRERNNGSLVSLSGLINFDYDTKANPGQDWQEARSRILKNPYLAYLFVSPGYGLKFGIRVKDLTPENFEGKEEALRAKLEKIYGVKLDASQGTLSQACFLCYDPEAIYRAGTNGYEVEVQPAQKKASTRPVIRSSSSESLADRLAQATADVLARTEWRFENGQRHNFLACLSIYANLRGIEVWELEEHVYTNYLPASEITSNVFSPYDTYQDSFGIWANDPFAYELEGDTLTLTGKISRSKSVSDALVKHVLDNPKTIIKAPTGAGKTYWVVNTLAPQIACPEHPLIIAVPTQVIADQVAQDYSLPKIRQGKTHADLVEAKEAAVVVATYDSSPALLTRIAAGTLVIDESHHLTTDWAFKPRQIAAFEQLMQKAGRVVQVSATPCPYWQRSGYKAIKVHQTDTKPIKVKTLTHSDKCLNALISRLSAKVDKGLQVVFWDHKIQLEAVKRLLIKNGFYADNEVVILRSDGKDENEAYQGIIGNSKLEDCIKVVLTTRLIADGVNIHGQEVATIHAVQVKNESLFVQFPARFRDSDLQVIAYEKASEDCAKSVPIKTAAALEASEDYAAKAVEMVAAELKRAGLYEETRTLYKANGQDWLDLVRDGGDKYVPFLSAIYAQEETRKTNRSSLKEMLYRIWETYPHFVYDGEIEQLEKVDTSLLDAKTAADKEAQKQADKQAYRLAANVPEAFALAAYQQGDFMLKKKLEHLTPEQPSAKNIEDAANLVAENKEVFERGCFRTPAKQLAELVIVKPDLSLHQAAKVLTNEKQRTKAGYRNLINRIEAQTWLAGDLPQNAKDRVRLNYLCEIREALQPGMRITPSELVEVVSKHTGKQVSTRTAADVAAQVYQLKKRKSTGGKERFWEIGERWTLENVLPQSGHFTVPIPKKETPKVSTPLTPPSVHAIALKPAQILKMRKAFNAQNEIPSHFVEGAEAPF